MTRTDAAKIAFKKLNPKSITHGRNQYGQMCGDLSIPAKDRVYARDIKHPSEAEIQWIMATQ